MVTALRDVNLEIQAWRILRVRGPQWLRKKYPAEPRGGVGPSYVGRDRAGWAIHPQPDQLRMDEDSGVKRSGSFSKPSIWCMA